SWSRIGLEGGDRGGGDGARARGGGARAGKADDRRHHAGLVAEASFNGIVPRVRSETDQRRSVRGEVVRRLAGVGSTRAGGLNHLLRRIPRAHGLQQVFDFMGQIWSLSLLLFTLVLLNSLSQFTGNFISEGVSSLNRNRGEDVLLHLDPKVGNETQRIKWYFVSKDLLLLAISPGKSRPSWIIPQKEYEGRLSAPDDKSLMLMDVTSEDSGCYEIHISSVSGDIHIQKFNLTVFGK
ncbi:uncharacterized protein LOC114039309, partial [Vombatus ursinus]|uniref:uncharacterized protein LOC114038317 n=1 Tax=Vombatus ursinus TaxID=29139 RepID=UPI000FFDB029